jgi:uncharacterized membrane protein (UPF0127 family)
MVLPVITAEVDGNELILEVASTPPSRECGLSTRKQLAADHGMLFVLPLSGSFALWMKDTEIPLSAAFLDASGRIIAIEQMEPLRTDLVYRSPEPTRYALELNRGWFAEHGVAIGSTVRFSLPPDLDIR